MPSLSLAIHYLALQTLNPLNLDTLTQKRSTQKLGKFQVTRHKFTKGSKVSFDLSDLVLFEGCREEGCCVAALDSVEGQGDLVEV